MAGGEEYDGRPASVRDGFNFQGDKQGSKWSTLVADLPKAAATGNLDLRADAHVVQVALDASGRADGVVYVDADGGLPRQKANAVCVAGNAIETARLLLLSACRGHQDGLATPRARWGATTCATSRRRSTGASRTG